MSASRTRLVHLIDTADDAYRRARTLVIDHLAPGEFPDETTLRPDQVQALVDLRAAEHALQDYRDELYSHQLVPEQGVRR